MRRLVSFIVLSVSLPFAVLAAPFNPAAATNEIGLNLFQKLGVSAPAENLIISPYSIESALVLAFAGADGDTRAEMARTLHLPSDPSADADIAAGFRTLRQDLGAMVAAADKEAKARPVRDDTDAPENGQPIGEKRKAEGIQWEAANRLFAQRDYAFRADYLALMRDSYAAPLEPLDFRHAAERARDTINRWVSDQTQNHIRNLVPAGGVTGDTRLVLVNALYLKARWNNPFQHEATRPLPFHLSSSAAVDVPTMEREARMPYEHENGLTVVGLDYIGRQLQCLILLPDQGVSPDAAAARITQQDLERWAKLGNHAGPRVQLHLPKLKSHGRTLPLGDALRALGMTTAFDQPPHSANFDRIAPRKPDEYLYISEVFHQTFVALDEAGTEASAATAVSMWLAAGYDSNKPIEVRVDRPFLFAIQHRPSGALLFFGRIADPR